MSDSVTDAPQAVNPVAQLSYNPNGASFVGGANIGQTPYRVRIRTNNSLWKDMGIMTVPVGGLSAPTVTLITGDLNQDNLLNLADYNIFVSCFGNKNCSNKLIADINYDGKVNDVDLNIFYSHLSNREGD